MDGGHILLDSALLYMYILEGSTNLRLPDPMGLPLSSSLPQNVTNPVSIQLFIPSRTILWLNVKPVHFRRIYGLLPQTSSLHPKCSIRCSFTKLRKLYRAREEFAIGSLRSASSPFFSGIQSNYAYGPSQVSCTNMVVISKKTVKYRGVYLRRGFVCSFQLQSPAFIRNLPILYLLLSLEFPASSYITATHCTTPSLFSFTSRYDGWWWRSCRCW